MIYIFDWEIDENNIIDYFWFNHYFNQDGYYLYLAS